MPTRSMPLRAATLILFLLGLFFGPFLHQPVAQAAPVDGPLSVEVIAAPNFVVDSNVLSPSTYAPRSATLGAKYCNTGSTALTNVSMSIGNFDVNGDGNGADSTPGIYPSRTHTGLTGTFSLTHQGGSAGTADASRFLVSLPAGRCMTQYWIVSYPNVDSGSPVKSVTGGIKPDDDLYLFYDIWGTAADGATTRRVDVTMKATMRNEISAAANKIWPNGTSKVPNEYLTAIASAAGWGTLIPSGNSAAYPGELVRTQGIWYDLGNVGAGFDNDGDGLPDRNAWVQPVGDATLYDPGCFRLVRTYGLVIVKLSTGGEELIPFVDQLYFENIRPDNTGAVGLVFYEYVALDGACTASLSPYQEVASGYDNEKFSGDYGFSIPPLRSQYPSFGLTKGVDKPVISTPNTLLYNIGFSNTSNTSLGVSVYGLPLVIRDAIPAGTTYRSGSAYANNTLTGAPGVTFTVLYSHDGGVTYSTTEAPASTVTHLQWWLSDALPAGASGVVRFEVDVPGGYVAPTVDNTAKVSFGDGKPFQEASVTTLVTGPNAISGTVFSDNGAGAAHGNGVLNAGESGIPNMTVWLFLDSNNDGIGDTRVMTATSAANGTYSFTGLPDGYYVVKVDIADPDRPAGYTLTTAETRRVALDPAHATTAAVTSTGNDFGFAPALTLDKRLTTANPVGEAGTVSYSIDLANRLPGNGTAAGGNCMYTAWAATDNSAARGNTVFTTSTNAFGIVGPNLTYASSAYANTVDSVQGRGFTFGTQSGTIVKVELLYSIYVGGDITDDTAQTFIYFNNGTTLIDTFIFTNLNPYETSAANQGLLVRDVTTPSTGARTWTWAELASATMDVGLDAVKSGAKDNATLNVDAIGIRVTTSDICAPTSATTLNPVPLTDTYPASKLQYVSSVPAADTVNAGTGTLTWNNVGPIYPGQTKSVVVTFKALAPAGASETVNNTATVSGAKFANGLAANNPSDVEPVTIEARGSIAGRIWKEGGTTDGWVGTNGHSGTDTFLSGVTVTLWACNNASGVPFYPAGSTTKECTGAGNNGTWSAIATATTDASGNYLFEGLRNGFYHVAVGTAAEQPSSGTINTNIASIMGDEAQVGDPTSGQRSGSCSTCDYRSDDPTANLNASWLAVISNANDVTGVNFGFTTPASIYGTVWQDYDGDGVRDGEDSGMVSLVELRHAGCTATVNCPTVTTGADGKYVFTDATITAGTAYTIVVRSLPAGTTWIETAETDATINNSISVTAVAGTASGSHDFGFTGRGTSRIGDRLYFDWDGDGTQDVGEEGIKNVTIRLYNDTNGNGSIDAGIDPQVITATTTITGYYNFAQLPAGNYFVVVDTTDPDFPASVYQTADPDEAGICVTCNNRSRQTAVAGTSYLNHDFGYRPNGSGSIGDTVYYDRNGDGTQSGVLEVGLPNVTVGLWVDFNGDGTYTLALNTVTDANGKYEFTALPTGSLPAGSYRVIVDTTDPDIPNDAFGNNLAASTPTSVNVTLAAGQRYLDADYGFAPLGAIGDTIFWDTNSDGEQDWTETGIPGVVVSLYNDVNNNGVYDAGTDTLYGTKTTDASGKYLFSGLPTGRYVVVVGAVPGSAPLTADPNTDGVPCVPVAIAGCDGRVVVSVTPGSNFMGADFGYQPSGVIGDRLWVDADADGVFDADEEGIPNITVELRNGSCTPGSNCPTAVTDPDGLYFFSGLAAGTYTVAVITSDPDFPASMQPTYDLDGTGTANTAAVTLGATNRLDVDFGYRFSGTNNLSGTVCRVPSLSVRVCGGVSPTGVSAGEAAYAGTTVFLSRWTDDGDGVVEAGETDMIASTTTSAAGDYSFANIPNGTYLVALSAPEDYIRLTTQTGDTPATSVVKDPASGATTTAYQVVTVGGATTRQNLDFAFLPTVQSDFGDLPLTYATTSNGDPSGPRHILSGPATLYLGSAPDTELDGSPSSLANGDGADEDGVTFISPWSETATGGRLRVNVTGSGYLVGYVDLTKDGDFGDAGEMIINQVVSTGTYTVTFNVPTGTFIGTGATIYSRFRLLPSQPLFPQLAYTGAYTGGEVEDYMITLSPTAIRLVSFSGSGDAASLAATLALWAPLLLAGALLLQRLPRRRRAPR